MNALRGQNAGVEAETTRELLELLRRDHYLALENGLYVFRYELAGRFWRINRGLGA